MSLLGADVQSLHLILQNFWGRSEGRNLRAPTAIVVVIFWINAKDFFCGVILALGHHNSNLGSCHSL